MGLWLPSSYRNPLAYPARVTPGFDPSHVAAPNVRLSAVIMASNALSLAPGLVGAGVVGSLTGSPTFPIDGIIGPTLAPAAGAYVTFASGTQAASTPCTMAAICSSKGSVNSGIFSNYTSGTTGQVLANFSSQLFLTSGGADNSSLLSTGTADYFFEVASVSGNSGTLNSAVVNLRTGVTKTATQAFVGSIGAGNNYAVGKEFEYGTTYEGKIAAVMHSTGFLGMPQILQWAADPWSFWYPPQRTRSYFYQIAAQGISFDAASNSTYQTAQSTYSWSHTCTGNNRYLTVGISMLSVAGSSVSSITYNSVALTKIDAKASVSGAVRAELWGLVAPASGSNTIAVTLSAALDSIGEAVSFSGVHQTSPYEGTADASATNVGAADATVNVSTVADNDWCIDIVATDDTAITVGAGQTSRNNVSGTLGSGGMSTEGPQTPAGSVTMSWTNVAALATWSIVSVALRPVTSSTLGLLYTQLERGIRGLYRGIFTGGYH